MFSLLNMFGLRERTHQSAVQALRLFYEIYGAGHTYGSMFVTPQPPKII